MGKRTVKVEISPQPGEKKPRMTDVERIEFLTAVHALRWSADSEWSARIRPHQARLLLQQLGLPQ